MKNMFRNFFYFSKGQRIAIITLILLILITFVADITISFWAPKEQNLIDTAFRQEVADFENKLREKEQKEKRKTADFIYKKTEEKAVNLFPFDPNKLDSAGFCSLGLPTYIAQNIVKYRSKGGKFNKKEDFKKIYGISEQQFHILEPYILIESDTTTQKQGQNTQENTHKQELKQIIIELNAADTTELMQLKGIGQSYAKRIVGYRKKLGGYANVEQLREVYGMTEELYEKIKPLITINQSKINHVKVNRWSVERMAQHPYINFYQAKAIYELRQAKKQIYEINELKHLKEFSPSDLERLEPYLHF